jgi:phenylacetate-CoA ligase
MNLADQYHVAVGLARAMRSQWWPAEQIRRYQDSALLNIMRHAVSTVPFYQRLNIPADSITSSADLQRFPLIGKREVQQEPAAFIAAGHDTKRLHASRTSGSSGQPTTTYFDREAWLRDKYILKMRRVAATAGLPLMRRVVIVSEQRPAQLAAVTAASPLGLGVFFRQRFLSIHTPVQEHLAELARFRPHMIYAFPSYLLDLITTAERSRIPLPGIKVLYTSSEVLTAAMRSRIESAFRGRLFDVYGSTEFKEVAWQCAAGRYHLNFESVYIESPSTGPQSAVVLSTLSNHAMPLLRFSIGDSALFAGNSCQCGRHSAQLLAFTGREGDMISLPSQRRLSPYLLTTAIESESSILQYQIVQARVDAFRIDVVVRSPGQSAAWKSRVCQEIERVVGEPVHVEVREVEAIERALSGKRSVFVRT